MHKVQTNHIERHTLTDKDASRHFTFTKNQQAVLILEIPIKHCTVTISLEENANLHVIIISATPIHTNHSITTTLNGKDAHCDTSILVAGKKKFKNSLTMKTIFAAPNGSGNIALHGIAKEETQMNLNGCIEITKNGTGTESLLTERILMLDPTPNVDAVPSLEIHTNDVCASHNATVSKIANDDLFYCESRGISEKDAKNLITRGFIESLLSAIPDKKIAEEILESLLCTYNA